MNKIVIEDVRQLFQDTTNIQSTKPKKKIIDKEKCDKEPQKENVLSNVYTVGSVMCGKVGNHPWWPCMVNEFITHPLIKNTDKGNELFVIYFGTREYSYLRKEKTLQLKSRQEFDEYLKSEVETKGKKGRKRFRSRPINTKKFALAWQEAENALQMTDEARIEKFSIKIDDLKPIRRKGKSKKPKKQKNVVEKPLSIPKATPKQKEPIKYAFSELVLPSVSIRSNVRYCHYCLDNSALIHECSNLCRSYFHMKCLETLKTSLKMSTEMTNNCVACCTSQISCYACYKDIDIEKTDKLQCSIKSCRKWYHEKCVETGSLHEMTKWSLDRDFICPRHMCHKCELINPYPKYNYSRLIVCIMCPATYHTGDWCIPAGSVELTLSEIICPRHLYGGRYSAGITIPPFIARIESKLQKCIYSKILMPVADAVTIKTKSDKKPFNVDWCFKCGEGGELLCCDTCPAAYHKTCVTIQPKSTFYCADCQACCYRCYGEVVWIKCGSYRWWPGQILHLENVPDNIAQRDHVYGTFAVQFFGSREYLWVDRGNVFIYEEDDMISKHLGKKDNKLNFQQGLIEAALCYNARIKAWGNGCSAKHVLNSRKYTKITSNKYVSGKRPKSYGVHVCECKPTKQNSNCSVDSNCLNIELKYECNPQFCKFKDACLNQNFMKRNYPAQEVFWSGRCGWALRAEEPIKIHQFVNEYVGEIIDFAESERRTQWAQQNNLTDFYYMELDNGRLLDARNMSNLSRFMNHSCDPNLSAEKWLVNGDHRIGLFALRDIKKGEELTFDYKLFTKSVTKIACHCKSENCSGFLGEAPNKRKTLIAKKKIIKREIEETGSISRESNTNTSSCPSYLEKVYEKNCFRCLKPADEIEDVLCSFRECPKIYHFNCLHLKIEIKKKDWICPWHFCDGCGKESDVFCLYCTTSVCNKHFSNKTFYTKINDDYEVCTAHSWPYN